MQYKKTTKKIAAIADELGVGAVLEGSVRRAGQRVRIVVHLVDPRPRRHLGRHLRLQLADIFEVQSEVAQQITGAPSWRSPEEKSGSRRRRPATSTQHVPAGPVPREQVGRSGRAQGYRVLPGRHRQTGYAVATPASPTPTSC
jgi:hypothetical protein